MLTHENVDFFGSEMVQNLLPVTVHLPALQNMVITKHNSSQYIRAFFKNSSVGGPSTKRDHTIPSVEK
jgi:hypothetical protein